MAFLNQASRLSVARWLIVGAALACSQRYPAGRESAGRWFLKADLICSIEKTLAENWRPVAAGITQYGRQQKQQVERGAYVVPLDTTSVNVRLGSRSDTEK